MTGVLVSMALGLALGFPIRKHPKVTGGFEKTTGLLVWLLLFLLGFGIGGDQELLRQIPVLGGRGLLLALGGIGGSVIATSLLFPRARRTADVSEGGKRVSESKGGAWRILKGSLVTVLFFAFGLPVGFLLPPLPVWQFDPTTLVLYFLMFCVGVGIGSDTDVWPMLRKQGPRLLLLPMSVVLGTLGVSAILGWAIPNLPLRESLAVGAGFGYYSLSSLMIREFAGAEWAAVALLANISREVLTLLAAPLLVRLAGPAAPVAAGGATSMDTTLGVVVRSSGREWALPSLFNGVVLTLLVPFLVTGIMSF